MRPLIISDTGLIMVLSLQSFSWCCCCDLCGMINKLMMSLFRFSYDCYLVDSLWAIPTLSVHFQGVVSLCQCHQRSWAQWSFQITIIAAATILTINITNKAFSIDIIIIINNKQVKKISSSFFRMWKIWFHKSCDRDVDLQKLLVSILSTKLETTKNAKHNRP